MFTKMAWVELFSLVTSVQGIFFWGGDKSWNSLVEELVQKSEQFRIFNDGQPTFLAAIGSSVIDVCISYEPVFDRCKHTLSTDEFSELFTCAQLRGQILVVMRLECRSNPETSKKFWIEKNDWSCRTSFIEGRIDVPMVIEENPVFLWNEFKNLLLKLRLFTNLSNVFQIIANRFGSQR